MKAVFMFSVATAYKSLTNFIEQDGHQVGYGCDTVKILTKKATWRAARRVI